MKRAFAIIIVVILAVGMVGLFFASFLQSAGTPVVSAPTVTTAPAVTATPTPSPAPFDPAAAAQ